MPAVALVESILPLHHHTQVLVVEDHDLDGHLLEVEGGQLLNVHAEAAVAIDIDHKLPGTTERRTDRGGQSESHGAQASRGEPVPCLLETVVLGGPHLVLAHAGGHDSLAFGHPVQEVDGVLGEDRVVCVLEAQRMFLSPGLDLGVPGLVVSTCHQTVELLQGILDVAHDRQVRDLVLVDLRRIDVDVHDLPVLAELLEVAGHPVVEPHAHGQEQVRVVDGVVGIDRPVHADHVQGKGVGLGEGAKPHQGMGNGDVGLPGEVAEIFRRT